jgi:hypothetical protein
MMMPVSNHLSLALSLTFHVPPPEADTEDSAAGRLPT